jgi:hypothetical protein
MDPQDARKTIHPKVIAVLGGGLLLKYRRSLRALADRRKARKAEQIRVGLPEADARVEAIGDQVEAIAIAFDDLPPTRANAAAARTIWKS